MAVYGSDLHELVAGKIFQLSMEYGLCEESINGILTFSSGYLPMKKKNEISRTAGLLPETEQLSGSSSSLTKKFRIFLLLLQVSIVLVSIVLLPGASVIVLLPEEGKFLIQVGMQDLGLLEWTAQEVFAQEKTPILFG